jgi:hypothetical protein
MREDYRSGIIAAILANVNRKKGTKVVNWYDFYPEYRLEPEEKTWQELLVVVEGINSALGGKDLRKEKRG